MAANDSFFRNQNGGCGYILKPDYLRSVSEVPFDPSKPEDLAVSARTASDSDERMRGMRNHSG